MRVKIKKAVSVLTVIALLLCPISAFAARYQGTVKWYYECIDDEECYDELPYYGEISLGKTTVEAPESDDTGESEYVFKMTAQEAGWYYLNYNADSFRLSTQEKIRDDGTPFGYSDADIFLVYEKGDGSQSITGSVLRLDAGEVCYLDFYYGDNTFTVNIEYLGEMTDVVPEQGMLDNLVPDADFFIDEDYNGDYKYICIYEGNFTAEFSGGKSLVIDTNVYPYSGEISENAGTYDVTFDFDGFKKDVSISIYDLGAEIDRVEIDNLDELKNNKIVVYYDKHYFYEEEYEADITVYFKDGTVSKASFGSDSESKPFTAPNGREYYASVFYQKNVEVGDIVLEIDAANYRETVGNTVLVRAGLSENLEMFGINYENEKLSNLWELYEVLAEIEAGTATFGDFFRLMFSNNWQLFKFFFTELFDAITFPFSMGVL
ncbi:MAG: hypothetical protein SPI97_10390 [Oscillospiraceae bacterium]|nr:hypothetical protein [Oscillospiraceae bacterium]